MQTPTACAVGFGDALRAAFQRIEYLFERGLEHLDFCGAQVAAAFPPAAARNFPISNFFIFIIWIL